MSGLEVHKWEITFTPKWSVCLCCMCSSRISKRLCSTFGLFSTYLALTIWSTISWVTPLCTFTHTNLMFMVVIALCCDFQLQMNVLYTWWFISAFLPYISIRRSPPTMTAAELSIVTKWLYHIFRSSFYRCVMANRKVSKEGISHKTIFYICLFKFTTLAAVVSSV